MFLSCFLVAAIGASEVILTIREVYGEQQSDWGFLLKDPGVKWERINLREEAEKSLITFLKYERDY